MAGVVALGLRTKILISLAVVMTLFIVLTEVSVSRLVRVSVTRQSEASAQGEASDDALKAVERVEGELENLRKLILFYMITGALVALLLGYFAVSRTVVRPLARVTRAVERVASGDLEAKVPISGSGEIIDLGLNFNRMTRTLRDQRQELDEQMDALRKSSIDLRETQDRLIRAAKLASVGTLAAGVAHEIGNPIAGVLGLLDALEGEVDSEQAIKYRALVKKEIVRIDKIIEELLAYARPARSGSTGEGRCAPEKTMEHVKSLLGAQRLFDKIDLVADMETDLEVAMSPDDMTQLMVNLLLNAGQAMEGKGVVKITAEKIDGWRPALSVVARSAVRITVTDDGEGIDPEIADRIFDPFFTMRESSVGSGLGLAICQSICDRAGAEITVDREFTQGARFIITVPA
jgi:two-component system, NtrC family, sensor kinase